MFNQDSILWLLGMIGGLIGLALGSTDILKLGPEITKWLTFASVVITFICTYLKQSPLPKTKWSEEKRTAYINGGVK